MKMTRTMALGAATLMVLAGFGCKKFSKDKSPVVANVAGEKITENQLKDMIKVLTQDDLKTTEIMKTPAERNRILDSIAMQKAMIRYGKLEGLEKDPNAKIILEQAQARAYFQVLMERRIQKSEPTEAQLKPLYDEIVAKRKAAGQNDPIPPVSDPQVKGFLSNQWKQKQEQAITENLLKDVKQKLPINYTEGYKPAEMPGAAK